MDFDLAQIGIYLILYMFGGIIGFGAAAMFCGAKHAELMAENESLRERLAELTNDESIHRLPVYQRRRAVPPERHHGLLRAALSTTGTTSTSTDSFCRPEPSSTPPTGATSE